MKNFVCTCACLAIAAFAAGEPVLKLRTAQSGMHRLTVRAMEDAGIDVASIDPGKLNVYHEGQPVPVAVESGSDGKLSADGAILFYGSPHRENEASNGRWDRQGCYFLEIDDDAPVRFAVPEAAPGGNAGTAEPGTLRRRVRVEDNYRVPYFNDDEKQSFDFLVSEELSPAKPRWKRHFPAPGLDLSAPALSLRARFYGRTSLPKNPDHLLLVSVGEQAPADVAFDGITGFMYENSDVPLLSLSGKTIPVTIQMPPTDGLAARADVVFLDWVQVEYPSTLDSGGSAFEVFANCPEDSDRTVSLTVKGLASRNVSIHDVGNGEAPRLDIHPASAGGFEATFQARITPRTHLVVTPAEQLLAPTEIRAFHARDLVAEAAGAELVVVAPPEFLQDAQRLAEHRRSQDLDAFVATTTDIYDNFGNGHKNPRAIRDFLSGVHAAAGSRLRYVLLAGSARQDPTGADSRTGGNTDYVPVTYYGSSRFAPFTWDNYYVAFEEGSEEPMAAIGRIPARSPAEFAAAVDKIVAYESFESPEWMNRNVLLCSVEQNLVDALESTAKIVADYNAEAQFERIFADPKLEDTIYAPKAVAAIDQGAGLVVFNGHGASHRWGQGPIGREPRRFLFDLEAVNELHNQNRFPIVLAATCYSNGFDDPGGGETIGRWWAMRPDGGAIAVVAPTYRVYLHEGNLLLNEFTRALFSPEGTDRLGDAFLTAQKKMQHPEVRATMTLLGDPSLRIAALRSTVDADYAERKAAEQAAKATPVPAPAVAPAPATATAN